MLRRSGDAGLETLSPTGSRGARGPAKGAPAEKTGAAINSAKPSLTALRMRKWIEVLIQSLRPPGQVDVSPKKAVQDRLRLPTAGEGLRAKESGHAAAAASNVRCSAAVKAAVGVTQPAGMDRRLRLSPFMGTGRSSAARRPTTLNPPHSA